MKWQTKQKIETWGAMLAAAGLCVLVVWGIYAFYAHVYMPEHNACSARGGVIVQDAFGVPTCAVAPVIVAPGRQR